MTKDCRVLPPAFVLTQGLWLSYASQFAASFLSAFSLIATMESLTHHLVSPSGSKHEFPEYVTVVIESNFKNGSHLILK